MPGHVALARDMRLAEVGPALSVRYFKSQEHIGLGVHSILSSLATNVTGAADNLGVSSHGVLCVTFLVPHRQDHGFAPGWPQGAPTPSEMLSQNC